MKKYIEVFKDRLKCEPPVIYYLLEESESELHKVNATAVESSVHQTKLKLQKTFYKPTLNCSLKKDE